MLKSFENLSGKELTQQYWIKEDDIWKETATVRELNVLSTRALTMYFYSTVYELLKKELGGNVIAAEVHSDIKHFAITPKDTKITLNVKIDYVKENHIYISGKAYDEREQIGAASFERVITTFDVIKRKCSEKTVEKS